MTTDPNGPADTTMMRIVHQALRRDLARASANLTAQASPQQRRAIASHLTWMMQFLRAHHESEDRGLYPLVRQRAVQRPEALELLDRMDEQHHAVAAEITAVEDAAATLAAHGSDAASTTMVDALNRLSALLLPHLREEEEGAMPIVSALITDGEWRELEQRYNLEPKSFTELGREGHWLIDDLDDDDRATVLGLVPPIPRFLLLHGFARGYRRHLEACWGSRTGAPRVQKSGSVAVNVEAGIDAVWEVARDVTRVGEWSHECVGASWIGDATAPVAGARFRGRNRAGIFRWGRVCEIVSAEPYELVWQTVPTALYPDSTEWRIRLDPIDGGTTIEQSFQVVRAPKVLDGIYARLIPTHRDRDAALTADLRRLGGCAAKASVSVTGSSADL